MIELRPLVPVLVEKDLAEQYQNNAGVIDLRALLNNPTEFQPITWGPDSISTEDFWKEMGLVTYNNGDSLPGVTSLIINSVILREGFDFEDCPDLTTLSLPNLTTLVDGCFCKLSSSSNVTEVSVPLLVGGVSASFNLGNLAALITLDLSSLETLGSLSITFTPLTEINLPNYIRGNTISIHDNSNLTTISFPNYAPQSGDTIIFTSNALDVTFINTLLATCLAQGMTSGTIDLSGGTNAAPTGQGISDKADLITAGVTVTTN